MKRLLLSTVILAFACTMQAQSFDYITFKTSQGESSLPAVGTIITFENNTMKAVNGDQTFTFDLGDFEKFYFSETSGVEQISIDGIEGEANVFNTAGQFVGKMNASDLQSSLTHGVYIIKQGNNNKKIVVR